MISVPLSYKNSRRGSRAVMVAALICLVFMAASCRTIQTIEIPVPIHDTTVVTHTSHDSVFVETTIREYVKGDTVYIDKTKVKYVERLRVDTLLMYKEVPVEVEVTTTEFVEKRMNWWQKTMMLLGGCFVLSVLIAASIFIIGLKKR